MIWPLPALLAWALAWAVFMGLDLLAAPLPVALVAGAASGALLSALGSTRWRRVFIAAGFPLSLAASGLAAGLPGWVWLTPLAALLLAYPPRTWRDAPLYPTPRSALNGLSKIAALPVRAHIVDAGCGLGAGLQELHDAYPEARVTGLEWSWPLVWACRWRCRFAQVKRADIWAVDWSAFDMVYLFQRPESMTRAVEKAEAELRPGAWLVSLEFEAGSLSPTARLDAVPGKPVWVYRLPFERR